MLEILKFKPGDTERKKLMKTVKVDEKLQESIAAPADNNREHEKDMIIINSEM